MNSGLKDTLFFLRARSDSPRVLRLYLSYFSLRMRKFFSGGFLDNCQEQLAVDVVIPTVSKDHELLEIMLEGLRKNLCHHINKIYIVAEADPEITEFCRKNDCHLIDERSVLGYGKEAIHYNVNGVDRSGWIFQQLLKLSGERFVEMKDYLVIDSDTVLINKHNFIEGGKFVFLESEEWHEPYFRSFRKMFGYETRNSLSYTSHMMIFNTDKLREMKKEMEKHHDAPWDKVYLSTIDQNEASCVSDYDTYANWMLCNFPDRILNKPFYNKGLTRSHLSDLASLQRVYGSSLKSLSFHSYLK